MFVMAPPPEGREAFGLSEGDLATAALALETAFATPLAFSVEEA